MKRFSFLATGLLLLLAAGCLQIETHMKLHEDGSATITERLQFSKNLLDLSAKDGPAKGIAALFTRDAASGKKKDQDK